MSLVIKLLLLFGAMLSTWLFYLNFQDPIHVLLPKKSSILSVEQKELEVKNLPQRRKFYQVQINLKNQDKIDFWMSVPQNIQKRKLPVIIILGGWRAGLDTFNLIPKPGNYILVVYRYRYRNEQWEKVRSKGLEIFHVQNEILSVPAHVKSVIGWLRNRENIESEKIIVMGVSLGALFMPAIYHLINEHEEKLHYGIIAFGGADLESIWMQNLRKVPFVYRLVLAKFFALLLHPVEPALHLQYLKAKILFINGTLDEQIPIKSARMMYALAAGSKKVIWLDTEHIQPNHKEIVQRVLDLSTQWLKEEGILNGQAVL